MFLSTQELVELTGRKVKAKQIEVLRRMGLPFFVNALGRPVVARAVVEGSLQSSSERAVRASWQPRVVTG
ncbi:DUF4224 domain-containing protein [Trinickia sp. EG282A]|uniref:DUF4224 domain-containing protein n=1 Tax=Trinickia sp. EG282A TaxID=3237013 RepID=UPI0034D16396